MSEHRHLILRRDGIDVTGVASFLSEALDLMRRRNDLADICALLATRTAELLPVEFAGIVLADDVFGLRLAGASHHTDGRRLLVESQMSAGPVTECLATCDVVALPRLHTDGRWPEFASACADTGIHAAFCVPISSHDTVFGVLALLAETSLSDDDLSVAEILTDVIAVAFLQCDPRHVASTARTRHSELLRSLDTIEQAKGMLSQRYGTSVDAAFDGLWHVSIDHGIGLARLAERVVTRTLDDDTSTALANRFNRRESAPGE
jgi:GAF domain-containing protein